MRSTVTGLFLAASFMTRLVFAAGPPETVHVTYHVREGRLDEFLSALKQHHPACRKLGLVLAEPHLILSGKEDGGKPVVIEILTWKDSDAPDSVPDHHPEVRKIWDRLNALTEKRGDKPKIEIDEMDVVTGAHHAARGDGAGVRRDPAKDRR
ncbi:MAG: hypothetical protein LC796_09890 [Acidobacteria bacterium]|nr:hypothetical protein [Acidobacteriota bacterium]MCA1610498.1 hypothetical protein [Acidobacteriota bacterium]